MGPLGVHGIAWGVAAAGPELPKWPGNGFNGSYSQRKRRSGGVFHGLPFSSGVIPLYKGEKAFLLKDIGNWLLWLCPEAGMLQGMENGDADVGNRGKVGIGAQFRSQERVQADGRGWVGDRQWEYTGLGYMEVFYKDCSLSAANNPSMTLFRCLC